MTTQGCLPCGAARSRADEAIVALAAIHGACEVDADCALVPGVSCAERCGTAVAASEVVAFTAVAAAFDEAECFDYASVCGPGVACGLAIAACVDGACRRVHPCDPVVAAVGEACDDGDPCTDTSLCNEAGACQGFARDCDDGNGCTVDRCDAARGCVHEARTGACSIAGSACTLGGICVEGVCNETMNGFYHTLSDAAGSVAAHAVAYDSERDEVIVVGATAGSAAMWLVRPDGEPIWEQALMGMTGAFGVDIVGDDRLVAGEAITEQGTKTAILVRRLSRFGEVRWSRTLDDPRYDLGPALAVAGDGTVAVAWAAEDGRMARVALTDLEGATPIVATIGAADIPMGEWPVERLVIAPADRGFVALRRDPASEAQLFVTTVSSSGEVGADMALAIGLGERPRGLLVLPDGDRVAWTGGRVEVARVRRFEPDGAIVWTLDVNTATVLLHPGELVAVGGPTESPFVVVLDPATGAEVARRFMPALPGPVHGATLAGDRLLVIGSSSTAWLFGADPFEACSP